MTLTTSDIDFLATDTGRQLLDSLAQEDLADAYTLSWLTRLRKTYTPEQSSAALEMARLRLKAVDKFGADSAHLFFTREALEQASDPLIRRYRAQFGMGQRVVDACCGIGSDSLAFAQTAESVLGLDNDPVRVVIAQYNAAVLACDNARFAVADVQDTLPETDRIFFDPARRDATGNRIYHVEHYLPPLSLVHGWQAARIAVKLSPGVDLTQLEAYPGMVEFISVRGDLKEAVLWLGDDYAPGLQATRLTETEALHWSPADADVVAPITPPRGWLVEPDPALLRAQLVQDVTVAFAGSMLDETIAYFTTDDKPESPWVRSWKINDWLPFNLKKLRAYLRERHVGQVTVKKRGSPLEPEQLIAKPKLKGDASRTLILTRHNNAPIVLICDDIPITNR